MPQPFPPTPPSMPSPPMFPASQTSLCPLMQPCSPSQPGPISASQSKSTGTTRRSPSSSGTTEAPRVYGFDLDENWQGDREHYDNQKVNGLTSPVIKSSAFTQKLDIEGCDPLALPVAALPTGQQSLASKTGPWERVVSHPYGGYRSRGVCGGILLSVEE